MKKLLIVLICILFFTLNSFGGPTYTGSGGADGTGTDDQTAAEVVVTPAGDIAAIEVQTALEELDGEKMSTGTDTLTSAELLDTVSDETGTGAAVFGTAPTFTTSITIGTNVITEAEAGYLEDVTSSVQDQIDAKEGTLTNEAGLYSALSDVSDFTQPSVNETITGYWTQLIFRGTAATGALGSIATADEFWTDGTYDPASLGGDYADGTTKYKALKTATGYAGTVDAAGNALFSTFTTTETEFIPVGYMIDGASAPDALATVTSGTEKVNARTFAGDADEDLVFKWDVPADLVVASGIKFQVQCVITSATAPSTETWQFELQGCSLGDGDALDCTLGTAQTSNSGSRSDAQYDLLKTAYSAAMTSTHITDLAVGEEVIFKLYRDVDDTDTYVQNVGVTGVRIKYVRTHDTTF